MGLDSKFEDLSMKFMTSTGITNFHTPRST